MEHQLKYHWGGCSTCPQHIMYEILLYIVKVSKLPVDAKGMAQTIVVMII